MIVRAAALAVIALIPCISNASIVHSNDGPDLERNVNSQLIVDLQGDIRGVVFAEAAGSCGYFVVPRRQREEVVGAVSAGICLLTHVRLHIRDLNLGARNHCLAQIPHHTRNGSSHVGEELG